MSQNAGKWEKLKRVAMWTWTLAKAAPRLLAWALTLVEYGVLGFLSYAVVYCGYCLVFGDSERIARTTNLIETVNKNWKALLVLLVPLFYRPVRTFLEEVREFGGMKRRRKAVKKEENPPQREEAEANKAENPPHRQGGG